MEGGKGEKVDFSEGGLVRSKEAAIKEKQRRGPTRRPGKLSREETSKLTGKRNKKEQQKKITSILQLQV